MNLSTTENSATVYGPTTVSTIEFVGLDNSSTVLDMSLVSSTGSSNITEGTGLTFATVGFWSSYNAFADDSDNAGLDLSVAKTQYEINETYPIIAHKGKGNLVVFKFKPANSNDVEVDDDGYLDLSKNDITEVRVLLGGEYVSSDSDDVTINVGELIVEMGAFDILADNYSGYIDAYVSGSETPISLAGPGLASNLIVMFYE